MNNNSKARLAAGLSLCLGVMLAWVPAARALSVAGDETRTQFRLDAFSAKVPALSSLSWGGSFRGVSTGGREDLRPSYLLAQEIPASGGEPAASEEGKFARPEPGIGQYSLDIFLISAATFAWKRALNVTAARRIVVETYDGFGDNVTTTPYINDANTWSTNWIGHPLLGMWFYQYFRSRGHTRMLSGVGSFLVSTIHEYLIETSFEPASGIDLIMTPGLGVPMGILTDEVSVRWVKSDSNVKRFFAYVMNPFLTMPWARWRRDIRYDPREDRFAFQVGFDY
ncbi:MAG: DUF3943 domain-containing protein [Bdellovibrionota bacterium]